MSTSTAPGRPGRLSIPHLRWYIAGLLMLATTVNYLDRQVLSVAVTHNSLDFSDEAYSIIQTSFLVAYAIMQPFAGRLMDGIGLRWGMALSVCFWSLANIGHVFARGVYSFASLRFLLGVGESGNYPGAIKAVAEWFPARERAMATGIFNIGSGTGAVIAPPLVAFIILRFGWQAAFVFTGALGIVWVLAWVLLYRRPEEHPLLAPEELAFITAGQEADVAPVERAGIADVLRHKEIWAVMAAKFLTDPVWYFYLFWLPKYLKNAHGFDLVHIGMFALVPYICADIGCVLGGILSTKLTRSGRSVIGARKLAMCVCACLMPAAIPAGHVASAYWSIAFICVAVFGHQCWSASLLVLPADLFPKRIVGTAYGLAGMCGVSAHQNHRRGGWRRGRLWG